MPEPTAPASAKWPSLDDQDDQEILELTIRSPLAFADKFLPTEQELGEQRRNDLIAAVAALGKELFIPHCNADAARRGWPQYRNDDFEWIKVDQPIWGICLYFHFYALKGERMWPDAQEAFDKMTTLVVAWTTNDKGPQKP